MDYNLNDLKKKSVINIQDGKDLGKISDLLISYPDGKVKGLIVPGRKNAFFSGSELIIGFGCIERIGDDAILVRLCKSPDDIPPKSTSASFDDEE